MDLIKDKIQELIIFDQILHNWGRIISDIGKRFVLPKADDDDSHANFMFNARAKQLEGKVFSTPKEDLFFAFHIEKNIFIFYSYRTLEEKATISANQSYFYIIKQIQNVLVDYGVEASSCPQVIAFRFPKQFDGDGYTPEISLGIKNMWIQLRAGAEYVLAQVLEKLQIESEIRIWPTNFNTGIFYDYQEGIKQWAGLALADDEIMKVPYFYNRMTQNGKPVKPAEIEPLKTGYWEVTKWNGAVLPLDQFATVQEFLNAASKFIEESTLQLLNHKLN